MFSKSVTHPVATSPVEWATALTSAEPKAPEGYLMTKTLVLKPKATKTAAVTPVMVIALESTSTNLSALGKKIELKEMRLAAPELLQEFFKCDKDSISPFALKSVSAEAIENVRIVLDSELLASTSPLAFHANASDKTAFVTGAELKAFLESSDFKYTDINFGELAASAPIPAPKAANKTAKPEAKESKEEDTVAKIGIEYKKEDNFPMWYRQVLTKGEMIEYYDVSGCYIYRPWSYSIWRSITAFFDKAITDMGVEPAYFPLFVSQAVLEKEKDHIEGFAPEVAWVTRAGNSELEVPVAIRPTSETVMYPYYAKWIRSYRDLPLRLNQWNSVVRWEFKNPQPFLRTREFLWQEGHTAFLTKKEADDEVLEILDLYRQVYTDLLAVPVIKGVKSEKEKFAGGLYTTTCEGYIPATGRAIQGATSHCLGQNFSKMFNIEVEDPTAEGTKSFVWQNSWGLSTRTIGVMVMVHGDDKGLVLPPRVASVQVVVIPCGLKVSSTEEERLKVEAGVKEVVATLTKAGVRAKADLRENYTPGYKFNHWELRGVPIRLEIGPMDLAKKSTLSVCRHSGAKQAIPLADLPTAIPALLDTIHDDMYSRAKEIFDKNVVRVDEWDKFVPALNNKSLVLMPWCEEVSCEEDIKENSSRSSVGDEPVDEKAPSMGAKSLCIPFEQPTENPIVEGVTKCVACERKAKRFALFGRSY
ncbi:hypothetical protein DSO57_1035870 [Entomophthora muscae]|uniref:Uncharacterized protein n=1 Tax=Entomophthora muscae TaxID=34485 RepID=A0ACC2SP38_9FUNG|nr:hypothetical protein DSO57_1035870 [Entomophthora muscae]